MMLPSPRRPRLLLSCIAATLAACAAAPTTAPVPRHVAPASGPAAKLVMRGSVQPGDIYGIFLYNDAAACQGQSIAGSGSPTRVPTSTTIAADRLQTVDFRLFKADKKSCLVRWTFTPMAGRTYLVTGAATATGCSSRVLDATDPDAIKPVETALVRNIGSRACVPLNEARAVQSQRAVGGQSVGEAVLAPGANASELEGLVKP